LLCNDTILNAMIFVFIFVLLYAFIMLLLFSQAKYFSRLFMPFHYVNGYLAPTLFLNILYKF
jgi:hypothetical protein